MAIRLYHNYYFPKTETVMQGGCVGLESIRGPTQVWSKARINCFKNPKIGYRLALPKFNTPFKLAYHWIQPLEVGRL